jgi:hypothetical protein
VLEHLAQVLAQRGLLARQLLALVPAAMQGLFQCLVSAFTCIRALDIIHPSIYF